MNKLEKIYDLYLECNQKITTDSRSPNIKNSIFFGIKGTNFNGNKFANDALKKGASFAIVDEDLNIKHPNIIKVKNCLDTLQQLAKKHRYSWCYNDNSKILLGITGTNGKTTTKELLKTIISSEKEICCTEGNLNNHIGVPLTILRLKKKHEIGIIELGANHMGEIAELCEIANPTHGIITNIGEAHLEGFENIENIIKTKNELYNHIKKNNGIIFINNLNSKLLNLINGYTNTVGYNIKPLNNKFKKPSNNLFFECNPFINIFWKDNIIKTKIVGNYNAENLAASITVSKHFNINDENIIKKLKAIELKNNRSQFIKTSNNKIILDAYNANPTSSALAIKNFIEFINQNKSKKNVIILGDMLELGETTKKHHQEIINLLQEYNLKNCILIGQHFKETRSPKNYQKINSVHEFEKLILKNSIKNSIILIKGSRKMQLEQIVKWL